MKLERAECVGGPLHVEDGLAVVNDEGEGVDFNYLEVFGCEHFCGGNKKHDLEYDDDDEEEDDGSPACTVNKSGQKRRENSMRT